MSIAIGIDLGTTNSVMAVVGASVKVVQNRQNDNLTKSAVGFYKGQVIVGASALDKMAQDPKNLITAIKRLMGRNIGDTEVQQIRDKYQYEIKSANDGSLEDIRVVLASKEYSPIEISALILKKLKEDAEDRLNDTVEFATITVPAYFTDRQIEATNQAGILAGFKVQVILDEPTAAAIAFSVDQVKEDEVRNIIVYDLGGGTFDVSVLTIAGGVCARLNTEGNMWLGGEDFDHAIVDFVLDKLKKEKGIDARKDLRFMMELKKKAEKAKIELSGMPKTDITLLAILKDDQGDFVDVDYEISADQFERMIEPQVKESIRIVKLALERARLTEDQIDNILLVGGSSTIPLVQRALAENFGDEKILKNVDPMLCVAFGAAIMANRYGEKVKCLSCSTINEGNSLVCSKCRKPLTNERNDLTMTSMGTNMPYGIETVGDRFTEIIPKNTSYPMQKYIYKEFIVPNDNLRRLNVLVYAGEHEQASKNAHQFTVWLPLPKGTARGSKLDVGFLVGENGTVSSVKLKLKDGSGIEKEVLVSRDLGFGGPNDRIQLEKLINEVKKLLDNNRGPINPIDYDILDGEYQEVIDLIEKNQIEAANLKAGELSDRINEIVKPSSDWSTKAENLISWSERAISKFGQYVDPTLSYKIRSAIEDLKMAVKTNNDSTIEEKFKTLDKVTDDLSGLVYALIKIDKYAYRASAHGLSVDSDKLYNIINEIDKAYKNGDYETIKRLIEKGDELMAKIDREVKQDTGGVPENQMYKSSH